MASNPALMAAFQQSLAQQTHFLSNTFQIDQGNTAQQSAETVKQ